MRKAGDTRVRHQTYNGWPNSIILDNGLVEVVVVPAVGRIMQFRRSGERSGPFWENRTLDGAAPDPKASEWINFGGDKTWPSPQADWPAIAKRGWPPPQAFDAMPVAASVDEARGKITLTSPVDPSYGIRTVRTVSLVGGESRMKITTRYEKVSGDPVKAGVWIITQLHDPEIAVMPVPKSSTFAGGYHPQSDRPPQDLQRHGSMLTMTRSRSFSSKIGNDAGALLWVGKRDMLLIESKRSRTGSYPDGGSSAEIYTNPDPLTYVELELLGPLKNLKPGDTIQQSSSYTLLPRKRADPLEDARAVLFP